MITFGLIHTLDFDTNQTTWFHIRFETIASPNLSPDRTPVLPPLFDDNYLHNGLRPFHGFPSSLRLKITASFDDLYSAPELPRTVLVLVHA